MDSQRRSERVTWALYGVLIVMVAIVVGGFLLFDKEHRDNAAQTSRTDRNLACTQAYDDAQYARQSFLQKYLLPKNDAQTALLLATINHAPAAELARLRARFAEVSATYTAALKANPLPLPPKLACGAAKIVKPSPQSTPTPTRLPTRAPSKRPTASSSPTVGEPTARPRTTPGRTVVPRSAPTTAHPSSVPRSSPTPTRSAPSPVPTGLITSVLCDVNDLLGIPC